MRKARSLLLPIRQLSAVPFACGMLSGAPREVSGGYQELLVLMKSTQGSPGAEVAGISADGCRRGSPSVTALPQSSVKS